jgi:hypothetical protein
MFRRKKASAPEPPPSVLVAVKMSEDERFVNDGDRRIDEEFDLKLQAFGLAHAEKDVQGTAAELQELRIIQRACQEMLTPDRFNIQSEIIQNCEVKAVRFAEVRMHLSLPTLELTCCAFYRWR